MSDPARNAGNDTRNAWEAGSRDALTAVLVVAAAAVIAVLVALVSGCTTYDITCVTSTIQDGRTNVAGVGTQGQATPISDHGQDNGDALAALDKVSTEKSIDAATEFSRLQGLRGSNATGKGDAKGNPSDDDTVTPTANVPLSFGGGVSSTGASGSSGLTAAIAERAKAIVKGKAEAEKVAAEAGDAATQASEAKARAESAADAAGAILPWTCPDCATVNPATSETCSKCGGACPTCRPK
jgi:hypothetical protein